MIRSKTPNYHELRKKFVTLKNKWISTEKQCPNESVRLSILLVDGLLYFHGKEKLVFLSQTKTISTANHDLIPKIYLNGSSERS